MELKEYLIRLCNETNESWREASMKADLAAGSISKYIRGTRPSRSSCIALADHFAVDPNSLLRLAGYQPLERMSAWREGANLQLASIEQLLESVRDELKRVDGEMITLPIYGAIPAGWPDREPAADLGVVSIPRSFVHGATGFWLKVSGSCLESAGIGDGDLILVEAGLPWSDGDIMAVQLATGERVARIAYREGDAMRLEAANCDYGPLRVEDAHVYGIVTMVLKRLKRPTSE